MKYKIIVDYGKPFEIICNNKKVLIEELKKIKDSYYNNEGDSPYFDIMVFKITHNKNIEITDEIIK